MIIPRFTWKSITFPPSLVMNIAFITLLLVYAAMEKTAVSWSCLLFHTQNKFYPRLIYGYEFKRAIRALLHGDISHFVLNTICMQFYVYFIEWHNRCVKYTFILLLAIVNFYLISCLINSTNVSSSDILYILFGMRMMFLVKRRYIDYWFWWQMSNSLGYSLGPTWIMDHTSVTTVG
jgi:hypothetical protein